MKHIAGAIVIVLGIAGLFLVSNGRIDFSSGEKWVDWDHATPHPTPNAGDAAVNATMVAQQQSAQMTASAAQSEMQATAVAAAAYATEQSMSADQVQIDQAAARHAESTASAIQVTVEHERFVATQTSSASTARAQSTQAAITATASCIQVTAEARDKEIVAEIAQRHGRRLIIDSLANLIMAWMPFMLLADICAVSLLGLVYIILKIYITLSGKKGGINAKQRLCSHGPKRSAD